MKISLSLIAALSLSVVLQAQTAIDAEVMAVQASRLLSGPFGPYQGQLPDDARGFELAVREWNTGTAVLLRLAANKDAKFKITEAQLVSFKDDTGKDLSKLPEGAPEDSFDRRKPVTFVQSAKTGEVHIVVASLRSPSARASRVAGEIELKVAQGGDVTKESPVIEPKEGASVVIGPFKITITAIEQIEVSDMPPHFMQRPPSMPGAQRPAGQGGTSEKRQTTTGPQFRLSLQIEKPSDSPWRATQLAVTDPATNSTSSYPIQESEEAIVTTSIIQKTTKPLKFKVSAYNTSSVSTTKVRFNTSLGVSSE